MDLFAFDKIFYDKGLKFIAGIDEAGRGPLAGPVVASAVILPKDCLICDLNDSKKLSQKKREFLFKIIKEKALFYAISIVDNNIIDKINILQATLLAMRNSISQLPKAPDICLIDGNCKVKGLDIAQETIVGGDAKSASIAAASILAKVIRDNLMDEYAKKYPLYGFDKHKGYGTKKHIEAINQYGVCSIHRMSFAPICNKTTKIL
ncbi:MAG: ribonuclease HII [Endomicrobium sp.]|jgi:ribonuclease HII|nr:ribonuclease HII [Endomicrobium sp.]